MYKLLIISMCIIRATCWNIHVNKNPITPKLTENVTISCEYDVKYMNSTLLSEIFRFAIKRFNHDRGWDSVAEISRWEMQPKTFLKATTVNGNLDSKNNISIVINFAVATEQSVGKFLCEMVGLDTNLEYEVFQTTPIVVEERNVSNQDVLVILRAVRSQDFESKESESRMSSLIANLTDFVKAESIERKMAEKKMFLLTNHAINLAINSLVDNTTTFMETVNNHLGDIRNQTNEMTQVDNTVTNDIAYLRKQINFIAGRQWVERWPSGDYSILKPDSGCPANFTATWEFSSGRVSTRPGSKNHDRGSNSLNLAGDTFQLVDYHHYVYMEMCTMTSNKNGPLWPSGSYCVQIYRAEGGGADEYCPTGFYYGAVRYGRYDDGQDKDILVNLYGNWNTKTLTIVQYCCRDDAPASDSIVLPRQYPFILYRFGGECQNVNGMDVSNQWLFLDTTTDHTYNTYFRRWHADGYANSTGARTEFCYYTPK